MTELDLNDGRMISEAKEQILRKIDREDLLEVS